MEEKIESCVVKGAERETALSKKDYLSDGYFSEWQWNAFCFNCAKFVRL